VAALALGAAACGSDSNSGSSNSGSSSSSSNFQEKFGTRVHYQGVGSGEGIAQFTAGTVDFGATDSAMTDEKEAAAKSKGEPVHVPTVLGAAIISYNVKGVEKGLKLHGGTAADIFLGKVKMWNDPAIAKLNTARSATF
jgi:phosphate transport system substrate-binding protein